MIRMTGLLSLLVITAALLLGGGAQVMADGRVPMPNLATPKGEQCVEPTDTMRRYHMEFLKTQRDDTMRRGIRGGKYSIRGCVECHAGPTETPKGTVQSVAAFCDQCHTYVGAAPDCWSCHNPVLDKKFDKVSFETPMTKDKLMAALEAHLAKGGTAQ